MRTRGVLPGTGAVPRALHSGRVAASGLEPAGADEVAVRLLDQVNESRPLNVADGPCT